MKLLCTALGHEFGDTTIEQHREERERGTVLTVREYRSCRRCGTEEEFYKNEGIVSAVSDDGTDGDARSGKATAEPDEQAGGDGEEDDAVIVTETETPAPIHDPGDPIDDGAEIVSDGSIAPTADRLGRSGSPSDGSGEPAAETGPRYRCPECGFEVPADPSPLHEGDICSNCCDGFIEYERVGRA